MLNKKILTLVFVNDDSFMPQNFTSQTGTICKNANITPLGNQGVTFETGGSL